MHLTDCRVCACALAEQSSPDLSKECTGLDAYTLTCHSGAGRKCVPPIRNWGLMPVSSEVPLGTGTVGGRGFFGGLPRGLLTRGSSESLGG